MKILYGLRFLRFCIQILPYISEFIFKARKLPFIPFFLSLITVCNIVLLVTILGQKNYCIHEVELFEKMLVVLIH